MYLKIANVRVTIKSFSLQSDEYIFKFAYFPQALAYNPRVTILVESKWFKKVTFERLLKENLKVPSLKTFVASLSIFTIVAVIYNTKRLSIYRK